MIRRMGFNKTTAREIVYGPGFLGGAEKFHLYDIQGYGQVTQFLKTWRTPHTKQGKMLRVVVHWAQFCVGTSKFLLQDTATKLPHLEAAWLAGFRQYLQTIRGSLEVNGTGVPAKQRQHDDYIMDIVLASHQFRPGQIKRINWCRLYLNVVTLSDIATAKGDYIEKQLYDGTPCRHSTWHQVEQKKPDSESWKQWRWACRLLCIGRNSLKLSAPLGHWILPPSQL